MCLIKMTLAIMSMVCAHNLFNTGNARVRYLTLRRARSVTQKSHSRFEASLRSSSNEMRFLTPEMNCVPCDANRVSLIVIGPIEQGKIVSLISSTHC